LLQTTTQRKEKGEFQYPEREIAFQNLGRWEFPLQVRQLLTWRSSLLTLPVMTRIT